MNKFTKRLLASGMAIVMSLGVSATSFAAETKAAPEKISVQLNGENVAFKSTQPMVKGGRTFVPFRDLFEALGATVNYEATTKTIAATVDKKTVSFVLGNPNVTVKEGEKTETVKTDAASFVEKGCTFVSLRFAAQTLGYTVGWDDDAKTAIIVDKNALMAELEGNYTIMDKYMAYAKQFSEQNYTFKGDMTIDMNVMADPTSKETMPLKATAAFTGITSEDKINMDLAMKIDAESLKAMMLAEAKEEVKEEAKATDVKATDVKTTDVKATDVKATDVKATDVKATDVKATDVKATDVKATDVKATDVKATDVKATDVKATDVKATDVKAKAEAAAEEAKVAAMFESLKDIKVKYIMDMESGKYYFNAPVLATLADKDADTWFMLDLTKMMEEMMPQESGFNFKELVALTKGASFTEMMKTILSKTSFNTTEDYAATKEIISMSKKFLSDEAFKKSGDTYTSTYTTTEDGMTMDLCLNFVEKDNAIVGYSIDLNAVMGKEPLMTLKAEQSGLTSTAKMSFTFAPFITMMMDLNMTMEKTTDEPLAKPADGKIVDILTMK